MSQTNKASLVLEAGEKAAVLSSSSSFTYSYCEMNSGLFSITIQFVGTFSLPVEKTQAVHIIPAFSLSFYLLPWKKKEDRLQRITTVH